MIDLFEHISTDAIRKQPGFVFSLKRDWSDLKQSLKEFGILNPLLVVKKQNQYVVLDGAARVNLAGELGIQRLPAWVVDESDANWEKLFFRSFELNYTTRDFNLIEKALIISQAKGLGEFEVFLPIYQKLGIKSEYQTKDYLNLLKHTDLVKDYIIEQHLPLALVKKMMLFGPEVLNRVVEGLWHFRITTSQHHQIIDALYFLSQKHQASADALLMDAMSELENSGTAQLNADALSRLLAQKRYPRYEKKHQMFNEVISELKLKNVKVKPSQSFEDDFVEVVARLSSDTDRNKLIEDLKKSQWSDLWRRL